MTAQTAPNETQVIPNPTQLAPKVTKKHQKEKWKQQIVLLEELTKVRLGPSKIHGVGVIATRNIKRGELLSADAVFQAFDLPYSWFKKLRPEVSQLILERWPNVVIGSHFVYPDTRYQAFMNHSDTPNYDGKTDKMLKSVKIGEEITEDYRKIEGWKTIFPWLDY